MSILISVLIIIAVFLATLAVINYASYARWRRSFSSFGARLRTGKTETFYRLRGEGPVTVVVCPALGSTSQEWERIACLLASEARVLTYDRLGYGFSGRPETQRTPEHIASELKNLIDDSGAAGPLVLVGHSQGGLYAQKFIRMYPGTVMAAIFIDPLTAEDGAFKAELSPREYRGSGADKSAGPKVYRVLSALGILRLFKPVITKAPPFYYYRDPSPEGVKNVWQAMNSPLLYGTVIEEYALAHTSEHIGGLASPDGFPPISLTLVLHDPEVIVEEIVLYGGLTEHEARKVEGLWKRIMERYLSFSPESRSVTVKGGSHFCHLDSEEAVAEAIRSVIRS